MRAATIMPQSRPVMPPRCRRALFCRYAARPHAKPFVVVIVSPPRHAMLRDADATHERTRVRKLSDAVLTLSRRASERCVEGGAVMMPKGGDAALRARIAGDAPNRV